MSERVTLATFDRAHDALRATAELRRRGFQVLDVYSPHAIHGIDAALGLRPSRLTWVCFLCGATGVIGALWFQHWANAVSWAINVGGKPWNSTPAEVPVTFEMGVLLAAFGSVLACLAVCRLAPGRRPADLCGGVTDDRYVIALGESSRFVDGGELQRVLRDFDVVEIKEEVRPERAKRNRQ